MNSTTPCAAAALLALVSSTALAQEVAPDRPSASDSAFTVAPGTVQIENGISYEKEDARRTSLNVLGRVGLTRNLELRIGADPIVRLRNGVDETGVGDMVVGAKYRALDEAGGRPAFALLPYAKLPTANSPIGSEESDFGLSFILSKSLPADFTADFNIGAVALGQPGNDQYRGQAYTSLAIGRSLTSRLSAYGEVFYRTRAQNNGPDSIGADVGVVYLVNKRVALDAAFERGLNSGATDYVVRAGVTILLGDAR